ncbi:hypothetical protein [Sphingomonas sp.]|jgi:ElaB/YqjD/DUF883 family membrane-anchored ribosome-binding protein|uniref:hypothetical protein n=1 Tax=Sphingomonas sp. TaxID=28214 RepID=UPI002D8082E0|nr:hypothetical protein [Sphingomonas sp.]HEU0045134.1 hypothetical protein [Sphingomonas sp.]
MAENDFARPMNDADITPPTDTGFTPAVPLKGAGVEFEADGAGGTTAAARQTLKDAGGKLTAQAGDKARGFAEMGKERAGGALEQLAAMLTDAAGQVDGKLGAQYGQYARSAAEQVQGLSSAVKEKDVDELLDDARALVRKSPAAAIGAAAAVGFVVARLIQSGLDDNAANRA